MFSCYMSLLLESVGSRHFGIELFGEEYPDLDVDVGELSASLEMTGMTVRDWSNPVISTILAELNHNFAQLGISFDENFDENRDVNYPESGIVWGEYDPLTKIIYIYVNDVFFKHFVSKDTSTNKFKNIAKDLYAQLAHEETHKYQSSQSKVVLKPSLPVVNNRSANRKYIQNIHEIDAFARQLVAELFRDMSYEEAIGMIKRDDAKLLEYKAYAAYKNLVGGEAMFSIRDKQKNPNLVLTLYQKRCIFTWNRFRQRTQWFLASLKRNHFADSAPDISFSNLLIEDVISI